MMWMQEDNLGPNYISIVSVSMWFVLLSSIQLLLTMIIQQVEFCCFIVTFWYIYFSENSSSFAFLDLCELHNYLKFENVFCV